MLFFMKIIELTFFENVKIWNFDIFNYIYIYIL